jgi:hypothetical protein
MANLDNNINLTNITIQKININVETNIEGENSFPLTYDKIHNPIKSVIKKSKKKLDYPYFTPDVKYSESVLMGYMKQDYSFILQTFFDISFFTKMVKASNNENKKSGNKTEELHFEYVVPLPNNHVALHPMIFFDVSGIISIIDIFLLIL